MTTTFDIGENPVHRVRRLTARSLEEMTVAIKHHTCARVTVSTGYQDRIRTVLHEQRVREIPQRVEVDIWRFGSNQEWL